jgi:hypothetical protein
MKAFAGSWIWYLNYRAKLKDLFILNTLLRCCGRIPFPDIRCVSEIRIRSSTWFEDKSEFDYFFGNVCFQRLRVDR